MSSAGLTFLYVSFLKGMFKTTKHFVEEDFSGTETTKSKRKRSPSYRMQLKASLSKQFLCTRLKLCSFY
jgi:formate hydrogenlyase subunit 6/NADH:ubiquinone oxidoreductase subunit I